MILILYKTYRLIKFWVFIIKLLTEEVIWISTKSNTRVYQNILQIEFLNEHILLIHNYNKKLKGLLGKNNKILKIFNFSQIDFVINLLVLDIMDQVFIKQLKVVL